MPATATRPMLATQGVPPSSTLLVRPGTRRRGLLRLLYRPKRAFPAAPRTWEIPALQVHCNMRGRHLAYNLLEISGRRAAADLGSAA